jgi:hypothetical protein
MFAQANVTREPVVYGKQGLGYGMGLMGHMGLMGPMGPISPIFRSSSYYHRH